MADLTENSQPATGDGFGIHRLRSVLSPYTRRKWFPWVLLGLICALAFAFRCLHLLKADHYYILSADSYYFHRMADLISSGETYYYPTQNIVLPFWRGSGLAYPIGLPARVIASITGVAPYDAVAVIGKLLPPAIGVITLICLWLVVSRMYGRTVAFLSSFAWAVAILPVFLGAAGYLDRDGISLLLVFAGVSVFYVMRDLKWQKLGRDLGWVMRGALVLVFEALLYVEWGFLGPVILLALVVALVVGEVLANVWSQLVRSFYGEKNPFNWPLTLLKEGVRGAIPAISASGYKPAILALAVSSIVAAVIAPGIFAAIYDLGLSVVRPESSAISATGELQGIGPGDILSLQLLIVLLVVGLYVTIRRRRAPDILWLSWFVVLFAAGLFARRLFTFAAPAICVLCGVGLGAMADLRGVRRFSLAELGAGLVDTRTVLRYVRAMAAVVLVLVIVLVSGLWSYNLGTGSRLVALTPEWQDGLTWLRENTAEDAVIMAWWDYGYWILDVAHRAPVVDNGAHGLVKERDIARVYCATDDVKAAEIMQEYGARYLVVSELEIATLPAMSQAALGNAYGDGITVPSELRGSLFYRGLNGQIDFDGGLRRLYPADDIERPPLVILGLE